MYKLPSADVSIPIAKTNEWNGGAWTVIAFANFWIFTKQVEIARTFAAAVCRFGFDGERLRCVHTTNTESQVQSILPSTNHNDVASYVQMQQTHSCKWPTFELLFIFSLCSLALDIFVPFRACFRQAKTTFRVCIREILNVWFCVWDRRNSFLSSHRRCLTWLQICMLHAIAHLFIFDTIFD